MKTTILTDDEYYRLCSAVPRAKGWEIRDGEIPDGHHRIIIPLGFPIRYKINELIVRCSAKHQNAVKRFFTDTVDTLKDEVVDDMMFSEELDEALNCTVCTLIIAIDAGDIAWYQGVVSEK